MDPDTLIEGMDPMGAAAVRKADDITTTITFSGRGLTAAMEPMLTLAYGDMSYKVKGTARAVAGEIGVTCAVPSPAAVAPISTILS